MGFQACEGIPVLAQLELWLMGQIQPLGGVSATFYIRDTVWSNQFRLALMPGVVNREPMYGFAYARKFVERQETDGLRISFFPNAAADPRLVDVPDSVLTDLIASNPLFGNFATREGVGASVRLEQIDRAGASVAVLWCNFAGGAHLDDATTERLVELFRSLLDKSAEMSIALEQRDPFPVGALTRILEATRFLSAGGRDLSDYLEHILDATLEAFSIDYRNKGGLGSVFRYDASRKILERVAHRGPKNLKEVNNVALGEGLISWVALRRRALLVTDVQSSNFTSRGIYVAVDPNTRSELAVPMMAGDRLVGVLNVESSQERSPFSPSSVRAVWSAANQASVAYRIEEERSTSERFLSILRSAADQKAASTAAEFLGTTAMPINELARLACGSLGSKKADVWYYTSESTYEPAAIGASYSGMDPSTYPRRGGFTEWIRNHKTALLVRWDHSRGHLIIHRWRDGEWNEQTGPAVDLLPKTLNPVDPEAESYLHLGLPIPADFPSAGVLWLKFAASERRLPSPPSMLRAETFAVGAGSVIRILERQRQLQQQQGVLALAVALGQKLFPSGLLHDHDELNAYVSYRSYGGGGLGGDFYSTFKVDPHQSVFLIGDAEKHGLEAALLMLPIIGAFRVLCRDNRSAKDILQKMVPLANEFGLSSTALCFIVDSRRPKLSGPLSLFVATAGHPPLIVIPKLMAEDQKTPKDGAEPKSFFSVPDPSRIANSGTFGWGANLPLGEEHHWLFPGDVIIACSDGIFEAGEKTHESGGLSQFEVAEIAKKVIRGGGGPRQIVEAIEDVALNRANGAPDDDMTVMVLQVRANPV